MKITLSTWERVQLAIIVGSGRAPTIEGVRLGLAALKVLNLSDEEKAKISWSAIGVNQAVCDWGREYELEFVDDVWQMIQILVQGLQSWPIDERSEPLRDKVIET